MERTFNILPGDMYCDDFSREKLSRSRYPENILDDENAAPFGYFYSKDEKFIRYEVSKEFLVDPISGDIHYKKINGKWVEQRDKEKVLVGPEKSKLISEIISGLKKSSSS